MEKNKKMENYSEEEELLNENIASNIKFMRRLRGLGQKQVGNIIGVGESTIANYESGIRTPNAVLLKKLADVFEISIDDLIIKKISLNNIKEITPLEFSNEVKTLLIKTGKLSESEKAHIIGTLDLICKKDDNND